VVSQSEEFIELRMLMVLIEWYKWTLENWNLKYTCHEMRSITLQMVSSSMDWKSRDLVECVKEIWNRHTK
jgi:hypothetical protein